MSRDTRARYSRLITERVWHTHEFMSSRTIACYLPADDEVDAMPVIARAWRAGKAVFAPVAGENFQLSFHRLLPDTPLERNRYGLWEPVSDQCIAPEKIDLVVTPVVAFDRHRHRIGMGSGYFDRCFSFLRHRKHWLRPKLLGLAFECQRVGNITPNTWDIRLYKVITECR